MLDSNQIKEELSYAYLHAVASRAGFACERIQKDLDGIDARLRQYESDGAVVRFSAVSIEVQLKATARSHGNGESLFIDLPVRNYETLRATTLIHRILIVLFLPPSPDSWLVHDETQLISQRCAYWASLASRGGAKNRRTVRIPLLRQCVVSPTAVCALMARVAEDGSIPDAI